MSKASSLEKSLAKKLNRDISCYEKDGAIVLEGNVPTWDHVVAAGKSGAKLGYKGVVNRLTCDGILAMPGPKAPSIRDASLEGERMDVLVIGGGVIGTAILRELSRWDIRACLIEKEADLAMHQSGRNAGMIHPALAPSPGSKKAQFNSLGNPMIPAIADELGVPFRYNGMTIIVERRIYGIAYPVLANRARRNRAGEIRFVPPAELQSMEPNVRDDIGGAFFMPQSGIIDPFMLTIAFAENAVENGATVWLNTMAESFIVEHGRILAVVTNRGVLFPKAVVNAAGLWADTVAEAAGDMFFTIHPRHGEMLILDKKKGNLARSTLSMPPVYQARTDTKGGGVIPTIDGNILIGPDAVELPYREHYATTAERTENLVKKQQRFINGISASDVITYFAGTRAATYEEDFVIERSERVRNLVHAAGIQSPGLTSSPAIAHEVASMCIDVLKETHEVEVRPNAKFNPRRNAPPDFARLPLEERQRIIKANPDYGRVVCRCEVITEGEIRAALRSPVPPTTLDGLKRRVRTGMGRCQGGFCTPLVLDIACDETGIAPDKFTKKGGASYLLSSPTRPELEEAISVNPRRNAPIGHAEVLSATNDEDCTPQALGAYDVVIIGGGPAGLAAAIAAHDAGAKVGLIEREARLGGILKQCVHDGFGTIEFNTHLTGPEYAERFMSQAAQRDITCYTQTFVLDVARNGDGRKLDNFRPSEGRNFALTVENRDGIFNIESKALVLATGCRERTARQVFIHGTKPAGIYSAGTAQYMVNVQGRLPGRRCVILGSGDVGLIMARRLTLEGATVVAVYEAKSEPTGLPRNISQCLDDFGIPLYLSQTVTKVFGDERVEAIEIAQVDGEMKPIVGTEQRIECDCVIVAVGLIPENELAETLGAEISNTTRGPKVDQTFQTTIPGLFACGNCVHVHDLVDYVTQSGRVAGLSAAQYAQGERRIGRITHVCPSDDLLYSVPQFIDAEMANEAFTIYFRSRGTHQNVVVRLTQSGKVLAESKYPVVRSQQMQAIGVKATNASFDPYAPLSLELAMRQSNMGEE